MTPVTARDDCTRDDLTREANRARAHLLDLVARIDRRGHDLFDLRRQLKRHARQLALLGVLAAVATASAAMLLAHRVATAASRRRRARWRLLRETWDHPDRALRRSRGPLGTELVRSAAVAAASALAERIARGALSRSVQR